MPALIVVGSQWGDEGKGKLVDILSSEMDFAVRYQGGANAGHSLNVEGKKIVVHLIPSAILHPHVQCLISGGIALDISALCEEIQNLKKMGKLQQDSQLLISQSATLLLDHHKQLDQAREAEAGPSKIGTTGRGVGPAYERRSARKALLFADLFEKDSVLLKKLKSEAQEVYALLSHYGQTPPPIEKTFEKIKNCQNILRPYRCGNMPSLLWTALQKNKKILFEGAQGALLDLFYGTYPYVTSSSTLSGGALAYSGLGLHHFKKTIAVAKAYVTRVGSGPLPTECKKEPAGSHLLTKGKEFGATTGRKRRCGWLDLPALRYALRLNSAKSLALMKLDVLTGLKEIKICVAYQTKEGKTKSLLSSPSDFEKAQPIYKTFKGWREDLSQIRTQKNLPSAVKDYIHFISKELNIPIDWISVGPSRSQTINSKNLF